LKKKYGGKMKLLKNLGLASAALFLGLSMAQVEAKLITMDEFNSDRDVFHYFTLDVQKYKGLMYEGKPEIIWVKVGDDKSIDVLLSSSFDKVKTYTYRLTKEEDLADLKLVKMIDNPNRDPNNPDDPEKIEEITPLWLKDRDDGGVEAYVIRNKDLIHHYDTFTAEADRNNNLVRIHAHDHKRIIGRSHFTMEFTEKAPMMLKMQNFMKGKGFGKGKMDDATFIMAHIKEQGTLLLKIREIYRKHKGKKQRAKESASENNSENNETAAL
jgi:hypothetical protein